MKALTVTLALLVAPLTAQGQTYGEYDDPCRFWYDSAATVFKMRLDGTPMPELMATWGNSHPVAAQIVKDAYHPVIGMPVMAERNRPARIAEFANRVAEQCYTQGLDE